MSVRLPILLSCVALLTVFPPAIPCRAASAPTAKTNPKIEALIDQLTQIDKTDSIDGRNSYPFIPIDQTRISAFPWYKPPAINPLYVH